MERNKIIDQILFFPSPKSNKVLIFVGGDGDDKDSFFPIVKEILANTKINIITFSYSPYTQNIDELPKQPIIDFENVISYVINELHLTKINIFCTSAGAYPTTLVLASNKFSDQIIKVIYFDPANYYYTPQAFPEKSHSWNGNEQFNPIYPTISEELLKLKSKCIVDVFHLSIRNHDGKDYGEVKNRGEDNPKKFSRLNKEMVKSFYTNLPQNNRGMYKEINAIPHAFMRDGDIDNNVKIITQNISKLL